MQFVLLGVAIIDGQALSQILPEEPDYFLADTYAQAKTLYNSAEQLTKALALFKEVAARDSNWCCWRSYVFMANIYLKRRQINSAKKLLADSEKRLSLQPGFWDKEGILYNLRAIQNELTPGALIDIYKDRGGVGFRDGPFEPGPELIGGQEVLQKLLEYPEEALELGITDTVWVKIHLSWRGTIRNVQIQRGGKLPSIRAAAMAVVFKTKWKPARSNDLPIDCWVSIPVRFNKKMN